MNKQRLCKECQKDISNKHHLAKFCSDKCRDTIYFSDRDKDLQKILQNVPELQSLENILRDEVAPVQLRKIASMKPNHLKNFFKEEIKQFCARLNI